jgi:hypothetical protein
MKTILEINKIETKVSKAGKPYNVYKTTAGSMCCFDAVTISVLGQYMEKPISVEVEEKNGFKNITKFYSTSDAVVENVVASEAVGSASMSSKDLMMQVSYAKDLFIALRDKETDDSMTMAHCCDLIKQAKDEFEQIKGVKQ